MTDHIPRPVRIKGAPIQAGRVRRRARVAGHRVSGVGTLAVELGPGSKIPPMEVVAEQRSASLPIPQSSYRTEALASVMERRWTRGRVIRWAAALAALVVLGLAGWLVYLVVGLENRIYVPLPPTPTPAVAVASATMYVASGATEIPTGQPTQVSEGPNYMKSLPAGRINLLVLGTDKRPDDPDHYARSDTLLLANIDTNLKQVRIMSIPRDLIADIPGYGKNKINAAYLFGEYYREPGGGQALSVRTVSQLFGVPVDYYVAINFQGFEKVVDSVGGVDIDVPYSIDDYNYPTDEQGDLYGEMHVHFDAGWQHMDGKRALQYARTRHADNDFARSKRQLQIILAVRQKAMSLDLLAALPNLVDALGGMVQTNIPFDQQLGLAQLGYQIDASNVITTSIDSSMIVPATLPDGSEGLKLNMKIAQPVLDDFFGWTTEGASAQQRIPEAEPTKGEVPKTNLKASPKP